MCYFIHQWLYSPLLGPGFFFSFVMFFTQSVGLLGRVISPSQGRYLHTGQHKHRIHVHTDIHALNGILTHDPSIRAGEDSSCLSLPGYRDRQWNITKEALSVCLTAYTRNFHHIHLWWSLATFKTIGSNLEHRGTSHSTHYNWPAYHSVERPHKSDVRRHVVLQIALVAPHRVSYTSQQSRIVSTAIISVRDLYFL
jgi:hypothetical protein